MNLLYMLLWLQLCLTKVGIFLTAAVPASVSKLHDYKVKVSGVCPSSRDSHAEITVITDLPVTKPFAVCSNKEIVHFTEETETKWKLPVYFIKSDTASQFCLFEKNGDRRSYFVKVHIPVTPYVLSSHLHTHVVTCNYDPVQQVTSSVLNVPERGITPRVETHVDLHKTIEIRSSINLYVADIHGNQIKTPLRIGNQITLVAELIGDHPDEPSFKVVSCRAIASLGEFYFLSKGCGNGYIIPENEGFITRNKKITSLPFPAFRIRGSSIVDFDCSFVICSENCDGSSCLLANHRRKRAAISVQVYDSLQPTTEKTAASADNLDNLNIQDIPIELKNFGRYNEKSEMFRGKNDNGIILSNSLDSSSDEQSLEISQAHASTFIQNLEFHKAFQSQFDKVESKSFGDQQKKFNYIVLKLENSVEKSDMYKVKSSIIAGGKVRDSFFRSHQKIVPYGDGNRALGGVQTFGENGDTNADMENDRGAVKLKGDNLYFIPNKNRGRRSSADRRKFRLT